MLSNDISRKVARRYSDSGRYFRGEYQEVGLQAIDAVHRNFSFARNICYTEYLPRTFQRYLFIADVFKKMLTGTVLDVGSRDDTISTVLKKECVLADKNNPALPPFDWEKEQLRFPKGSFDAVVCLDTLEHIEAIHEAFHDLLRVSRKYVIISLPNCWKKAAKKMALRGDIASYGLPPEKPFDRHRWFFNAEDAVNFIAYNASIAQHPFRVVEVSYHMPKTIRWHRILYPLLQRILPEYYFKNFFVETIFVCLEREETVLQNGQ